ncbi:peptidase C19 family protein [Pelomyxa schiedti]|nr:peptidase C19 family protein [Pelomyxa schiedti]
MIRILHATITSKQHTAAAKSVLLSKLVPQLPTFCDKLRAQLLQQQQDQENNQLEIQQQQQQEQLQTQTSSAQLQNQPQAQSQGRPQQPPVAKEIETFLSCVIEWLFAHLNDAPSADQTAQSNSSSNVNITKTIPMSTTTTPQVEQYSGQSQLPIKSTTPPPGIEPPSMENTPPPSPVPLPTVTTNSTADKNSGVYGCQIAECFSRYFPDIFVTVVTRVLITVIHQLSHIPPVNLHIALQRILFLLNLKTDVAGGIVVEEVNHLRSVTTLLFVKSDKIPDAQIGLCQLLVGIPKCIPHSQKSLIETLVRWLSNIEVPSNVQITEFDDRYMLHTKSIMQLLVLLLYNFNEERVMWAFESGVRILTQRDPIAKGASPTDAINTSTTSSQTEEADTNNLPYRNPSPALASLFQNLPPYFAPRLTSAMTANTINQADVELALSRVMSWPLTVETAQWVVSLLRGLIVSKQYTVLIHITLRNTLPLMLQLYVPQLRVPALRVLDFMLIGYQHSPDAFHALIPYIPDLIKALELSEASTIPLVLFCKPTFTVLPQWKVDVTAMPAEVVRTYANICSKYLLSPTPSVPMRSPSPVTSSTTITPLSTSPSSGVCIPPARSPSPTALLAPNDPNKHSTLRKFCKLLYTLIYQHTGYPEMYECLLAAMSRFAPPPEPEMLKQLQNKAWTNVKGETDILGNNTMKSVTGRVGLSNLGNTCYMNSFLQSLFLTESFRAFIFNTLSSSQANGFPSTTPKPPSGGIGKVLVQLGRIFAYLQLSQRYAFTPKEFLSVLPSWCRSGRQQDSSEFGKFLFESLEKEINASHGAISNRNSSVVQSTNDSASTKPILPPQNPLPSFGGKICIESFTDIPLPLPQTGTSTYHISSLIDSFFAPEALSGSNQYFCSNCGKLTDAEKVLSLAGAPPNNIIFTISRFLYENTASTKLLNKVHIARNLNLQVYDDHQNVCCITYSAYAVVMHSGPSSNHGHYYTFARPSSVAALDNPGGETSEDSTTSNGSWFLFNDSHVSKSSFSRINSVSETFASDVPYIVFYTRNVSDPSQSITAQASEIPALIRAEVLSDNTRFLQEQQNNAQRNTHSTTNNARWPLMRYNNIFGGINWNDKDDDSPPGSSDVGGGGGGGGFLPHLVF